MIHGTFFSLETLYLRINIKATKKKYQLLN